MTPQNLWKTYSAVAPELVTVEKIILTNTKIRNKTIQEALQLFFHKGGKLLRPALFLYFSKFGSEKTTEKHYRLAASLEILHAATLIHDDIIDDSPMRRGLPSIQTQYGKDVAVYTGDFLFTVYFELLAGSAKNLNSLKIYAASMKKILVGELDQMNLQYNTDVKIKEYIRYLNGKTAQLFRLSCYMGASAAEAPLKVQVLSQRIGHQIGMAFQILDDILDYAGTQDALQKPIHEDIRNGMYTLPLIFALKDEKKLLLPILAKKEQLSSDDIEQILRIIQKTNALEKAQEIANRYTEKALGNISSLPENPVKEELYRLTQTLLCRHQ